MVGAGRARWSYSEAAEEETPVEKTPHDLLKELSTSHRRRQPGR